MNNVTPIRHQNRIHPTAIVGDNVEFGEGNYIGPYCYIDNCKIGNFNRFEAYCSIGTPPEHKTESKNGIVCIGNKNIIREFITINAPTKDFTFVGSDCYIMRGVHIGHDAIIEDGCTLSSNACVGGHAIVMKGANLGLMSVLHQRVVIGSFCMIGMNSTVTHHIKPFLKAYGTPIEEYGVNKVGLTRKFGEEEVNKFLIWCGSPQGENKPKLAETYDGEVQLYESLAISSGFKRP